jgi:hypothetical protein
MTISHYIVALVGVGYMIVGVQQLLLKNTGAGIMWIGYSFSQIGLYMGLAK